MKGIKMKKTSIIAYTVATICDLVLTVFNVWIGNIISTAVSSFAFGACASALLCIILFFGDEKGNETTDHPQEEK